MKSDKKKTAEAEVAAAKSNKNLYIILGVIAVAVLIGGIYWWSSQPAKFDIKTQPIGNAQSPTEAYKMLYAAVKTKTRKNQVDALENSLAFAEFVANQQKKTVNEVVANGFTATTFQENLPPIRDERIKDGFGALEVQSKEKNWEDLPFILDAHLTVESIGGNREAVSAALTEHAKIPADKIEEFLSQLPQTIKGLSSVQAEDLRSKLAEAGATASVKTFGWKLAIGDMFKGTYQKPGLGQAVKEQEAANAANNNMIPVVPSNANVNNANVQMIVPKNSNAVNRVVPNVTRPNSVANGNTNSAANINK